MNTFDGVIIKSIGLVSCMGSAGNAFCDEFLVDLDPPEGSYIDMVSCQNQGKFAFAIDNFVTICTKKTATEEDVVDVELQNSVKAMCWDESGQALLATDSSGTLHFINSSGTIIFSKKLIPGMDKLDNTQPAIMCFLDTGTLLVVENLPVSELCVPSSIPLSGSDLASLFKRLKVSKVSTPFRDPCKVLLCTHAAKSSDSNCLAILGDSSGLSLVGVSMGSEDIIIDVKMSLTDARYTDVVILPSEAAAPALALLLSDKMDVSLLNLTDISIIRKFSCSMMNPLSGGCNGILMADLTCPSPGAYDIIFSIGTSTSPCGTETDKSASPHVYTMVLMDGCNILLLDDSIAISSRDNSVPSKQSYQIGDICSDNPSQYMTCWRNSAEVSIVSYSYELRRTVEALRRMRNSCDLPACVTNAAEAVALLMFPEVSPEAFALIETRMATFDIAEMVMVLRHSLLCHDTTSSFFQDMLMMTMDAMERVATPRDLELEVRYLLKCLQTASAYDWEPLSRPRLIDASSTFMISPSSNRAGEHSAEVNPRDLSMTDMSSPVCDEPTCADRHTLEKIFSLLGDNCNQTYIACVSSGRLEAASAILKIHLHDMLPATCDTLLSSVSQCPINEVVDWVKRDVLPSLHRQTTISNSLIDESECDEELDEEPTGSVADRVCNLLLAFAIESEKAQRNPYDALLAANLAVYIASSMLDSGSADNDSTTCRANAVQKVLDLEVSAWRKLGLQISFETVEKGGLNGIVDMRLRSLEESEIVSDIQTRLRPFLTCHNGDVDDMLFNWIMDTLKSSVVKTDGDDDDELVDDNEEADEEVRYGSVQVTRLVNVADGMNHPNLKALAVISLLQILSASACVGSAPHDSSQVVFETLSRMRDEVSGSITNSIADSLLEAFRTHKLRALAAKYAIRSLNLRDPKQIREAVSLIVTKTNIPSSVADALNFAESYSSSGVDICAMLVRALVCRIIPLDVADVDNKDESVKAALQVIPRNKLTVVAEDTCSYLMSVVDAICIDSSRRGLKMGSLHDKKSEFEFAEAINGVLQVSSYLLDAKSDDLSTLAPDTQVIKQTSSVTALRNIYESSYITTEFQTDLKRIKKLHSDFSVFIGLESLWSRESSVDIVKQHAIKKCDEILGEVEAHRDHPNTVSKLDICNGIVGHSNALGALRKLCTVLDVSFVFALHVMQRHALTKGIMELGMTLADLIGDERRDVALIGNSSCNVANNNWFRHNVTAVQDDGELVLNAAVTLCGAAAKKAQQENGKASHDSFRSDPNKISADEDISAITPFILSSDLLRLSTLSCLNATLGKTVDLLNACELVTDVYMRMEGSESVVPFVKKKTLVASPLSQRDEMNRRSASTPATAMRVEATPYTKRHVEQSETSHGASKATKDQVSVNQLQSQITGMNFNRDGILLSPAVMWGPLARHLLLETKRREAICQKKSGSNESASTNSDDVDKLVAILQRSENHMLAVRVLLGSWHQYNSKKQSLHQSLTMLGRKVLSYRDIDKPLAVSCLSSIPYDVMVRELRGAVPSIQSDFSRLRTVAQVGEQLANMWEQEELLVVFQSLQTNAKWWHVLSAYGVKIDPRAFQSSIPEQREACIRAVVPALLEKSGGDISLCMEYCSQFDLEAHFASTCYIEYTLLNPPTGTHSVEWTEKIKAACSSVEESLIVSSLQSLLPRIHQLDYEKIRYTCTWIIDILSEEEVEDSANRSIGEGMPSADESDEEPGSGVGSRTRLLGSKQVKFDSLVEECTTYLNIATFLASLSIPMDMAKSFPHLQSYYNGLSQEYLHRVPFWELLREPWVILEPLMNNSTELSSKLTPICAYLKLERDEYYVKRATNLYSKCMSGLMGMSADSITSEYDKVIATVGDVVSYVKNPVEQVKVWKSLYDMEKERYSDVALRCLERAHLVFDTPVSVEGDPDVIDNLRKSVLEDIVKHKSRAVLQKLDHDHQRFVFADGSTHSGRLLADRIEKALGDLNSLVKLLLEYTVEKAWVLQLRYLRNTNSVLCCFDVLTTFHLPIISDFVYRMGEAISEISQHHQMLCQESGASHASGGSPSPSTLQMVTHAMIGRLLADADIQKEFSDQRVMMSASEKGGHIGLGGAGNWGGGAWGSINSGVAPSQAENRRRDDLFKAFAISVLIASCTDISHRSTYISQLMVVGKGAGARSQRRLTARSKFRAIQGLFFLDITTRKQSLDLEVIQDLPEETKKCLFALDNNKLMGRLRGFLYCLAELQELRLPCSEDTLADALGFDLGDSVEGTQASKRANPSSLVSTWLHDEGHDSAVCELSRDVLIIAKSADMRLWGQLWTHMLQRGYTRAVIHTFVALNPFGIIPALLRDKYISSEMAETMVAVAVDIAERSEQISALLTARDHKGSGDAFTDKENSSNHQPLPLSKVKKQAAPNPEDTSASAATDDMCAYSRRVVLMGDVSPWSCTEWDECPEDVALVSHRLSHVAHTLALEYNELSLDISKVQQVTLRLMNAVVRLNFVAHSSSRKTHPLLDNGVIDSTTSSIMAGIAGLLDLVHKMLSHRSLYSNRMVLTSPFSGDVKLREFLLEILCASYDIMPKSLASNATGSDDLCAKPSAGDCKYLSIQCLCSIARYFGKDIVNNVLSRFCGWDVTSLSKSLSFDDTEDSDSSAPDSKQHSRLVLLLETATTSTSRDDNRLGQNFNELLMNWVASRDEILASYKSLPEDLTRHFTFSMKF